MGTLEVKIISVIALIVAVMFGMHLWESKLRSQGAAQCTSEHDQMVAKQSQDEIALDAKYRSQEAAAQSAMDLKERNYVEQIETLRRAAAARAAVVGVLQRQLAAAAAGYSAAASAPANSCGVQDRQLASGAGFLSQGVGLVGECLDLVGRLNAQLRAVTTP